MTPVSIHCAEQSATIPAASLASVTVIIPALNEEQSLPFVLRDLPEVGRVIVVDNGSTDASAEVAAKHGAIVVQQPKRRYLDRVRTVVRLVARLLLAMELVKNRRAAPLTERSRPSGRIKFGSV